MALLIGLLMGGAVYFIFTSGFEYIQQKQEQKFSLYDEVHDFESELEGRETIQNYKSRNFAGKLEIMLKASNLPLTFQEFLIILLSIYIFTSFMVGSFTSLSLGLLGGIAPLMAIYFYLNFLIKNKTKIIIRQLPDFTIMFASGYEAGYSIENCFDYCAKELKYPINAEMSEIYHDITHKKLSLIKALKNWYERNPNEDIEFAIKGLLLCQEKSGDVSTIMGSLQEKLRDRAYIDRFIQKRTQSLRFTAKVVQGLPMGVIVFLFISNTEKMIAFSTSMFGIIGFSITFTLYTIGMFVISKFINNVYKD